MCNLCKKADESAKYKEMIDKMLENDQKRLENSVEVAREFNSISKNILTSVKWPVRLIYPFFEVRLPFAVPNNYFQNILLDGDKIGNSFSHGSMRSIFFADNRLMILSKAVSFRDSFEFFTSFILLSLDRGEYKSERGENGGFEISANILKPVKNLITAKVEKRQISFRFVSQPVAGHIVSKEQAAASSTFKNVYGKYAGGQIKSGSMDMEGYAITVPHFSPHPYLLLLHQEFGYSSNRDFQEYVHEYFSQHLQSK